MSVQTVDTKTRTAVEQVAGYAAALRFSDLPELAVLRARQVMLDTLGTALAGYQTPLGQLAADYAATMIPGEEAQLLADGRTSTTEGAAWANGVMAKYLGMDDSHRQAGHVAAELIPVVLSLGYKDKLDGRAAITALAAGYDVFNAIQPAVSNWQRERGLDHKGQAGTLASAVTAAVLMGLPEEAIGHALALSMDMASGTEQYVYDAGACDTKDLLAGYAARNGIFAAKMAEFGFRGPPGALDGPYGYYHAFGPGYDPAFIENIGRESALASTGFKPHAGCRHVHSCVDATQQILEKGAPPLDAITAIEIDSYRKAISPSFRVNPDPQTLEQAGFSLPVTVSVVLARGSWYREDIAAYDEPAIRRLRSLVRVGLDDRIEAAYPEKNGCEVRVYTGSGEVHTGRVEYAKGEPENMLTENQFIEKFRYLAGEFLPPSQLDALIEATNRFEKLDDVGDLVRLTIPE